MPNKQVYFGEVDNDILQYANKLPNFSTWVKRHLYREMIGGQLPLIKPMEGVREVTNSYIPPTPTNKPVSEIRQVILESNNIKNDIAKDTIRDMFDF